MTEIFRHLKEYKKECALAPLFKMLEALFELFVPLVVAAIIDQGIAGKDISYIIRMSLLMVLLALIGLVFSITAQYFASVAAVGSATSLRHSLFEHIQSFSYTELDTVGTSTMITRMTSDINQIQNAVNLVLRLFLRSPFIVFGAMVMAFTIDREAALIFVAAILLLSVVVFGIILLTKPLYKKVQDKLDTILRITRENLSGVRVIRAFNKEEEELKEFREANESLTFIQKFAGRFSGLMNPVTYIIINACVIALIWTGAVRVDQGILTQGQVVALYNYMTQILVELIKLANLIITMTKAAACAGRVSELLGQKSGLREGTLTEAKQIAEDDAGYHYKYNTERNAEYKADDFTENDTDHSEENDTGNNDEYKAIGRSEYSVEFRNVGLAYLNAGEKALTDINFRIRKGDTVGIIGGTGSGKSSLVNLIPRFYDATEGEVLIDGVNVREYTFEALRRKVSVVPQKAQLFEGSIRDNLLMGGRSASEEDLEKALVLSQSKEFVRTRDGQLDAAVEQEGRNLSGGQKQRLTIARALVKNAGILILDDSASALDYATDARLRKAISKMEPSTTVFIVSQRASSVVYASQIIVLEDGRMAGIGTHEELLEHCEIYREIYYSQFQKEAQV